MGNRLGAIILGSDQGMVGGFNRQIATYHRRHVGGATRLAAREGVYLLKPNLRELRQLARCDLEDEAQQVAAAKEIVDTGQSAE